MSEGQYKILFVDDEPVIREIAESILTREGHTAVTVATAEEAQSYLAKVNGVHLVVTDIGLKGGMSGLELITFLEQNRPEVPVLAISGHHTEEIPGTVGLVRKPFTLDEFKREIKRGLQYAPVYEHA